MKPIHLLIVEDDRQFAEMLGSSIAEEGRQEVEIDYCGTLADAARELESGRHDAVILDLGLPDTSGLDGLDALREVDDTVPVIVLTGSKPEDLAVEAIRSGAQDYIVKSSAQGDSLDRAIRYAIERQHITAGLQRTVDRLRGASPNRPPSEEANKPLSERDPASLNTLARLYVVLLESSMRPGVNQNERTSAGIEEMATRLHELNAGPRDVVDVHLAAIDTLGADERRSANLITQAQILLLEVMGNTLARFRAATMGAAPE